LLTVALLALAGFGCATVDLQPTDPPTVELIGGGTVRYVGSELAVVLGYDFAARSLAEEWLLLDLTATAVDRASVDIRRQDIFVRTPAGTRLPLLTQGELVADYAALSARLKRASVAQDPFAFLPASRRPCRFDFFSVPPGTRVIANEVGLNDRRACQERLVFRVPGGIQPGRWVLGIDLPESSVRVPFELVAR
jgi:hypothetical protein